MDPGRRHRGRNGRRAGGHPLNTPRALVVRDQFALRSLSNEALAKVLPIYERTTERILREVAMLPAGRVERELRLVQTLTQIRAQVQEVSNRLIEVLPEAQVGAFIAGLQDADSYLRAVGVVPAMPASVEGTSAAVGGVAITQQQLVAVARETGFTTFPGLLRNSTRRPYSINTATAAFEGAQVKVIERRLREGFLASKSTSEIVSDVRASMGTANRRQVEALVRTSMAEASQTAHDAFNQANEDVLGDKNGNRYIWDASNDGRLCPICAPLDETRYKTRAAAPWPAHWNERCRILPLTPLHDELARDTQSFLEQTPVQYDAKGRRLPPPDGWDGDNAYKQPRRIDGVQYWQRRRDIQGGSAGHMLQAANDPTALSVLGTQGRLDRFRKLTGPGGRFADDPQGAVVELLRPGTARKAPRARPTPPRPPAAPQAPPRAVPVPAAAPPPPPAIPATRPGLTSDRIARSGNSRLTNAKLDDTFETFRRGDDLAAANWRTMEKFVEKQNISYGVGFGGEQDLLDTWLKNPAYKDSLAKSKGYAADVMRGDVQLATPDLRQRARRFMDPTPGTGGHTHDHVRLATIVEDAYTNQVKLRNQFNNKVRDGVAKSVTQQRQWLVGGGVDKSHSWVQVLVHETGHQVHFRGGYKPLSGKGTTYHGEKPEKGWGPMSSYGATLTVEDFAESFVAWVFAPEELQRVNPKRYAWVEAHIARALR